MASKEIGVHLHSTQDRECVARFVYDALVYTLPKCGLHETEIPPTDFKQNDYGFSYFIERFGVGVLGASLKLRDRLKQMFESRRKNIGIRNEDIPRFLRGVISCLLVNKPASPEPLVITCFTVCKEFILYFFSHQVPFDLNIVIATTAYDIFLFAGCYQTILNIIEKFVNRGEYWSEHISFTTYFISKYDVPYGSTEHILQLFNREYEAFKCTLQKELQLTGLSTLQASSENTVVEVENSNAIRSNFSTNISVEKVPLRQNCNESSKLAIEDDLRQMHLDNKRTSHEGQGAIPKQSKSQSKKKR